LVEAERVALGVGAVGVEADAGDPLPVSRLAAELAHTRECAVARLPAQGQVELDGRSDRRVHENLGVYRQGDGDTRQLVHGRLRRDGDRRQLRDLHRSLADHVAAQTMQALIVGRDITGVRAFA
jgi:hypothetical protein